MAYEKTVWVNGQAPALDADHLNKMEQGIADAVSVTPQTLSDGQKAQARENIGAAPGGFGLGDDATLISADTDLNSITKNGWYQFSDAPIHAPTNNQDGWASGYSALFVNSRNSGVVTQTIFCSNTASVYGCQIKRVFVADKWYPWEWVNPPMDSGIEYRTTERYQGKPVYAKLVDCGTVPAQGTYKDFVFSPDVNSVVSISAYSPQRGTTLPYYDANGVRYSITSHGAAVTIWNYSESLLDTDVRALIKYTKTTD